MAGGINQCLYAPNPLIWFEPVGWIKASSELNGKTGIYSVIDPKTRDASIGSSLDAGALMSQLDHKFAQNLLSREGVIQKFIPVDLGKAKDWTTKNRILRHFEQKQIELMRAQDFNVKNLINAEAPKKNTRNAKIASDNKATKGKAITCKR